MPNYYTPVNKLHRLPARSRLLARRVQIHMQRMHWGKRQLAKQSGLSLRTVQRVVRGNQVKLSCWSLARLAYALGLSTDYLLGISNDQTLTRGVLLIEDRDLEEWARADRSSS